MKQKTRKLEREVNQCRRDLKVANLYGDFPTREYYRNRYQRKREELLSIMLKSQSRKVNRR